ncbi:MAG: alkaline phosphatase family protein [Ignavibacteriota bacterium]
MKVIATVLLPFCWIAAHAQSVESPRLIVIGIDGLSVDGVATAKTPRIHELMDRAAWTLAARGVMPTLSSPNWASMIDGAGPEQHGITSNGILRKMVEIEPVCRDSEGMFPHHLRSNARATACQPDGHLPRLAWFREPGGKTRS